MLPRQFRNGYNDPMFPIGLSDLMYCLAFGAIAFGIALALGHYSRWTKRRVLLISAAPIPGCAATLFLFVFLMGALSTAASCGVDTCGMMMGAGASGLLLAAFTFLLGLAFAAVAYHLVRR